MPDIKIRDGAIRKIIDDFTGGYNLFLDPTKIRDNEFTQFENFIIYEKGRLLNANKRRGFERYNTNVNVGNNAIRSVFETIWKTKGINNRTLIKTANSLEFCEGSSGGFSSIATGLSDSKMSALIYKDNVYIANNGNGTETNTFYDGTNYLEIGTPPCYQSFNISKSATAAVNLTAGYYSYLISFLYDDTMESSIIFPEIYDTQLTSVYINNTATAAKLNINSIPIGNARVKGRVIYRTKKDANIYYYLTTIHDNTTTQFLNDDTPDTDLGDEYNGGNGFKNILKPYKSKYHVVHQRRIWQANLYEDGYGAVSLTGITSTGGTTYGGLISRDAVRAAIYTYKFANDTRVIAGKELTGTPGVLKPPYRGYLGALSSAHTITPAVNSEEVIISNIPVDTFYKRTAVLRNVCQFISGISVAGSVLTVTVATAAVFKEGETVTITGVTGFTTNPNGTFVINTVGATTFKITHNTVGGSYTAASGVVQGSNYYITGFTIDGSFIDLNSDSYLTQLGFVMDTLAGNKYFKSSVISSEADQPDIFPPGNFMNLGQDDGEEITGIFSDQRRLIVFKETSIYEIDTTYQDTAFARARRIVKDIGAAYFTGIVQTPDNGFIFYSKDNYFYFWPGEGMPQKISDKIQADIDSLTFTNLDGVYYPRYNWIVYTYSTSTVEGNVLIFDMNVKVWYHFKKTDTNLNLCAPISTKAGLLIFGNRSAGYLMKYGANNQDSLWTSGTTYDTKQITVKLQTKYFPDEITVKRLFSRIQSSGVGASNGLNIYYGTSAGETSKTEMISSTGLNIIKRPINLTGREFYMRIEHAENLFISIKSLGFEYSPVHTAGDI